MDLRQIKQFMALAEAKNFHKAAESIGLTQSALTQAVSKLEKELEVQLFIRSKTGSLLTEHGQRLYDHAKVILAQVEAAERELRIHSRQLRAEVRLGVVQSLTDDIIWEVISHFRERYPSYNVKVIKEWSGRLAKLLASGEIDFAFLSDHFLTTELPEFQRELIFTDTVQIVVGSKHELFARTTVTLADLPGHQWVAVSVTPDWPEFLARVFAAADVEPPERVIKTNSMTLATYLIAEGHTIGIVSPKLFQTSNRARNAFKYFDVPELRQHRRFTLCHRARMVLRPHHYDLIEYFRTVVRRRIETAPAVVEPLVAAQ
jgi:DNA-binding transcriptional LysR family regulator